MNIKKGTILLILSLVLLLILPVLSYANECSLDNIPLINLKTTEELFEYQTYSKNVTDKELDYLTYIRINSTLSSFKFNEKTGFIKFTPNYNDIGIHKLFFIAIDDNECYNSKLVTFHVYDEPKITPIKPTKNHIILDEGQNMLFDVYIEDKDEDIIEYSWYVNGEKQDQGLKERFAFVTQYNSKGIYDVSLSVLDRKGLNDTYGWTVDVRNNNRPPYQFSDIPDHVAKSGSTLVTDSLDDYFNDPDQDILKYSVTATDENNNLIDIISFGENNELIINPSQNFSGVIVIEITVTDSSGDQLLGNTFSIHVVGEQDLNNYITLEKHVCGDMVCGGNETCDNCMSDCGPCSEGETRCNHDWKCVAWTECIPPGFIIRQCNDYNKCYDRSERPITIKTCKLRENCFDNIRNNGETKVDCGGPCDPCPSCNDRILNQGEQDIDCGGPCNKLCPTCRDSVQNQFESDIDCGGPCDSCEGLKGCYSWKDCQSHICINRICTIPTCFDGMTNQDENGVDCEGVCGGVCSTCYDGLRNQDEEKIDCGGVCEVCPTCNDDITNQNEKYVDCGGECRKCDWSDFEKEYPNKSIVLEILFIIFSLIFIFGLLRFLINSNFVKSNLKILIFLNKLRIKTAYFSDIKKDIDKIHVEIKKIIEEKETYSIEELKEKLKNILTKFIVDLLKFDINLDKEIILTKIKEKNIEYPLNMMVFMLIKYSKKIISDEKIIGFDRTYELKQIIKILDEMKKEI